MSLVLDAGALLAFDKGDRNVRALLERAARSGVNVITTTGAVSHVWRNGARRSRLALLLRSVLEVEPDPVRTRRVGILLGRSARSDVVDGSVVEAASDGDETLTSDPDDIETLALRSGKYLVITPV